MWKIYISLFANTLLKLTHASYFKNDGVGIAYITNGTVMGMNDILIGVLSIYFNREYEFPTFAKAIKVK